MKRHLTGWTRDAKKYATWRIDFPDLPLRIFASFELIVFLFQEEI